MRPKAPAHDPTVLGALHEARYRQILKRYPDHPDALHLLGMVTHSMGDTRTAVDLSARVIRRSPYRLSSSVTRTSRPIRKAPAGG